MQIYCLSKAVLKVNPQAVVFLNGLTSNTPDAPRNAFLNINGRVVATFDQVKVDDDIVLVAVETPFADAVISHLDRYARLIGVKIEKTDYRTCFDLAGDYPMGDGEFSIPQKKGQIIITRKILDSTVSESAFTRFRLDHDIPVQGVDYRDEFLLNISESEHVSFSKGCFLGQEPVSKVHSRSQPSWQLVVKYEHECSEEERGKMTSKVSDGNGRVRGFVFVRNQGTMQ